MKIWLQVTRLDTALLHVHMMVLVRDTPKTQFLATLRSSMYDEKIFCFGVRFFISYCRYNNFQFDAYSKPSMGSDLVSYFVFKKVYLDVKKIT